MAHVRDVLSVLERVAPSRFAFPFDKVGLQVGDPNQKVVKAAVSLDRSLGAIRFARDNGCTLLLSHHPLLFSPLETVDALSHVGRSVMELAASKISFIAAHTNWDSARGGINDRLVEMFGLTDVKEFGMAAEVERLKLVFFCPGESCDKLIDAVSAEGAGVIGAYSRCAFSSSGTGTFFGGDGTAPTVGQAGQIETLPEVRVEMSLEASKKKGVLRALLASHPYEQVSYDFVVCSPWAEQPAGRLGILPRPMTLVELVEMADSILSTRSWFWGAPDTPMNKVAIVGGAADGEWMAAQSAGADVLLTGEVKQHVAVEATECGMPLIASGHFQTEHPGSAALCERMAKEMPDIEWLLFTPEPGLHGRPGGG